MKFSHCMVLSILLLAVVGFVLFPGAGRDDKYISFWPAYTLSESGEMVNYDGMRVEQSSSLLLVLLLAGLRTLSGASLVMIGYGLSIAAGLATLIAVGIVGRRLDARTGMLSMLLTATATYFVYWTFGSMEVSLVGLLSLWVVSVLQTSGTSSLRFRRIVLAWLAFLAFILVRPESPLVLGCTLGFSTALALLDHRRVRTPATRRALLNLIVMCATGAGSVAMVLVFRLAYFGRLFPQPVEAKSHLAAPGVLVAFARSGVGYLLKSPGAFLLAALAVLGLAVFVVRLRAGIDHLRAPLVGFALAYGAFIVLSGGDWMGGSRFVAHMTPVAAILAADGISRGLARRWRRMTVSVAVAAQLGFTVLFAHTSSMSLPLWNALDVPQIGARDFHWIERINYEHRRDTAVIEVLDGIVSHLPPRPLAERPHMLAYNVGMVLFYEERDYPGRLGTIDLHGLSDRYVTDSTYRDTIPSWALGLIWNPGRYLKDHDRFAKDTGVPYPSLVYWDNRDDVGGDLWTEPFGFTTYLAQRGRVSPAVDSWFHGRPFGSNQFLSVNETIRREARLGEGFLFLDMERLLGPPPMPLSSVIERVPAGSRR